MSEGSMTKNCRSIGFPASVSYKIRPNATAKVGNSSIALLTGRI
jgi:hypothetical protein